MVQKFVATVTVCLCLFGSKTTLAQDIPTGLFGLYAVGSWEGAINLVSDSKFKIGVGINTRENLDLAHQKGIKSIVNIVLTRAMANDEAQWNQYLTNLSKLVSGLKAHPAVYAWYPVDEPDWQDIPLEKIAKIRSVIKSLDTEHPVFTVLTDPAKWSRYFRYFDIISIDPYLKTSADGVRETPEKVDKYIKLVRRDFRKLKIEKPLWVTLGAFELKPRSPNARTVFQRPTPTEFRQMAAIALGSKIDGLLVFTISMKGGENFYDWNIINQAPLLWEAVKEIPATAAQ